MLGGGKGRVRRIAVRMPDGRQVNLLATGEQRPQRLLEIMRGRWMQENAPTSLLPRVTSASPPTPSRSPYCPPEHATSAPPSSTCSTRSADGSSRCPATRVAVHSASDPNFDETSRTKSGARACSVPGIRLPDEGQADPLDRAGSRRVLPRPSAARLTLSERAPTAQRLRGGRTLPKTRQVCLLSSEGPRPRPASRGRERLRPLHPLSAWSSTRETRQVSVRWKAEGAPSDASPPPRSRPLAPHVAAGAAPPHPSRSSSRSGRPHSPHRRSGGGRRSCAPALTRLVLLCLAVKVKDSLDGLLAHILRGWCGTPRPQEFDEFARAPGDILCAW
jgi:hypothetical protein